MNTFTDLSASCKPLNQGGSVMFGMAGMQQSFTGFSLPVA
jgi:hypothetical protein